MGRHSRPEEYRAKQDAAAATGARFYGDGGTIHSTGHVDVELHQGEVVAVWFRCQLLPFRQAFAMSDRAAEMRRAYEELDSELTGVEIRDGAGHASPAER